VRDVKMAEEVLLSLRDIRFKSKVNNPISVQATKSVKQNYQPSEALLSLMEAFRHMVNDCIRIGIEGNITSMKSLSLKAYHQLESYDVATCYRLTAISKAAGILRNYRKSLKKNPKTKRPYVRRIALTDCYGFKIENDRLRLTIRAGEYEYIPLNNYTLKVLSDPALTVRSVSLTACTLSIAFSKETDEIEPTGAIGIDRNLDNITTAGSDGSIQRFDLSEASKIKASYREVKSHFKRNDVRIRRRICRKYGLKERNKVSQILHHTSKEIIEKAKISQSVIVMEKLTGIRKLYHRGNGQGRGYRFRLNSWSFAELQRQIEYKAKWEGLPVIYVSARDTSKKCSVCGCRLATIPEESRLLKCSIHGMVDRDVNAARNILARGVRFAPFALPGEAMVQEPRKVILKVDGSELSRRESHVPKS
jgi:putative transposase